MIKAMDTIALSQQAIERRLDPAMSALIEVHVCDSVGSTNDAVVDLGPLSEGKTRALLAEEQTLGRGRRGRQWQSPHGANLYCSVAWQFAGPLAALGGLSLAVGADIAGAVAERFGVELDLKWPNDLYHNGRKLGGILVEVKGEGHAGHQCVIGMGVNVRMPDKLGAGIDKPWVDFSSILGAQVDRNDLAAAILSRVVPGLFRFARQGLAPWLPVWAGRDFLCGRKVVVDGQPPITGIATGVDANGALLVDTIEGRVAVAGGEASLIEIGEPA